jgi:hypothetical protein
LRPARPIDCASPIPVADGYVLASSNPEHCAGCSDIAVTRWPMTIKEEIVFSIFVAAALVMGWRLILSAFDYVLR